MFLRPRRRTPSLMRSRRFRSGGAILEAALVLPILLGLAFGMVEYGYYFFVKHTLQGAARDGARVGIVPSATNAKVNTAVDTVMQAAGLSNVGYQVDIKHASSDAPLNVATTPSETPVKVVVRCNWSAINSGLRPMGFIDDGKQVIGSAVMMKE